MHKKRAWVEPFLYTLISDTPKSSVWVKLCLGTSAMWLRKLPTCSGGSSTMVAEEASAGGGVARLLLR